MRLKLIAAAFVATALLTPMAMQALRAQSTGTGRVIVKYKADSGLMHPQAMTVAGARATQMRTLGQRIGTPLVAGSDISGAMHVVFARGLSSTELAAKLSADSDVEYAVPDRKLHRLSVPNDPLYTSVPVSGSTGGPTTGQWYLKPPGPTGLGGTLTGTAPSAINAEDAWDLTTGSASIVVAVLDTGLRFDHADLQGGNVLAGYDMIAADDATVSGTDGVDATGGTNFATAHDGNGRDSDASDPGDGITQAQINADQADFMDCSVENSSWHGTQTLSLIGASTNNGIGMASVARNVSVMPVRVLGRCGSGYNSDILAGMLWAGGVEAPTGVPANTHPARVLNLSLGGDGACDAASQDVITRLNAAGVVVVVSAGNSGIAVGSPANCTGAIGVAGLRSDGDKLGVSSFGPAATIAAPGGNCPVSGACTFPILAAFNSGALNAVPDSQGGSIYTDAFVNVFTGTSFSAPLVAGTAALMLSVQPSLTPAEVKARLMASARPFPTSGSSITGTVPVCTDPGTSTTAVTNCYCTTSTCGAGMLDVHAAVLSVATATTASIAITTTTPTAGTPVTLTSTTTLGTGATGATYTWAITNAGTTSATITSGQGTATLVVTPTAAGSFTVNLTTVDSLGVSSVVSSTITVAAVVTTTTPTTTSSSSGGGGGAIGIGWLALLLSAIAALAWADRLERRAVSVAARSPRRR